MANRHGMKVMLFGFGVGLSQGGSLLAGSAPSLEEPKAVLPRSLRATVVMALCGGDLRPPNVMFSTQTNL